MVEPIHTAPRFEGALVELWGCGCWWNNCYWSAAIGRWIHHKLGPLGMIQFTHWAPVPSHRKGIRYVR